MAIRSRRAHYRGVSPSVRLDRVVFVVLAGLLTEAAHADAEDGAAQWLAVTAPAFRAELAPLIEHRRAEGFKVTVVETTNVLTQEHIRQGNGILLRDHFKQLFYRSKGPNYVLLVGAVTAADPATAVRTVVPTLLGTIGRMKGESSDYGYSLQGKDGSPVAVGRFPARSVEEVRFMVRKTLDFERDSQPGAWR